MGIRKEKTCVRKKVKNKWREFFLKWRTKEEKREKKEFFKY
jgi:hypothetical protein